MGKKKRKTPILKRIKWKLGDLWYWLRCHLWTRYHIINIRKTGDYKWGWIDRGDAIFLACFALLKDFVEKEEPRLMKFPFENNDLLEIIAKTDPAWRKVPEAQYEAEVETHALYHWWISGRNKEWEELRELKLQNWNKVKSTGDLNAMDSVADRLLKLEARDQEMLLRLIKIRDHLWT